MDQSEWKTLLLRSFVHFFCLRSFLSTAGMACVLLGAIASSSFAREYEAKLHETTLTKIETLTFRVGSFAHSGGAIEQWGKDLLVATPTGQLILVRGAAEKNVEEIRLEVLPETVPMGLSNLWQTPFAEHHDFNNTWVRVADILITRSDNFEYELYVSHHLIKDDCIAFVVSRIAVERDANDLIRFVGPWQRIFEARPCVLPKDRGHVFSGHQVGGKMVLHSSGELWIALGDHGFDGVGSEVRAPVDDRVDLGKILAINTVTGATRIVARGLRNPQGLLISQDGLVWETEHGPRGGDELNLISEGANYGWPLVTLGRGYNGPWPLNPAQGRHDGFEKPRFAFVPSVAISALAEINGPELADWDGDLAVATLKRKSLYRIRRDGDRIIYAEPIAEIGLRFRDVVGLKDGRLALLADSADIVLVASATDEPSRVSVVGLNEVRSQLDSVRAELGIPNKWTGGALFSRHCASCHNLDGTPSVGPHLSGLLTRDVGSTGFAYSTSLALEERAWTSELLYEYLDEPREVYADTLMPRVDLSPAEIREVIRWLGAEAAE